VIFHIVKRREWQQAVDCGTYAPPSLQAEGFIHCSTHAQTLDTANHWFRGQQDLVLLHIDPRRLAVPLRLEQPAGRDDERREERFPHIYGPLNLDAVVQVVDFPCEAGPSGSFRWP